MSVYISGDTHGDFQRFTTKNFPQLKGMDRDNYVIITGDHGGVWAGEQTDRHRLDWLEDKPFTTLRIFELGIGHALASSQMPLTLEAGNIIVSQQDGKCHPYHVYIKSEPEH